MNIFRRLFKIGEAETQSAIDKLEDPIKMTEQGIRDLKADLDESLHSLAEVKALAIRAKNDIEASQTKANEYENKAIALLKKAQGGSLDASEADRLAGEALQRKEESLAKKNIDQQAYDKFATHVSQLDTNVKKIKSKISSYENELKTLKARVKVSSATKKLNKQIANIDASGTVSMLERMKDKVAQEEALAESYGEIANESRSLDDEINAAIDDDDIKSKAASELAAMKDKLGIEKNKKS